MQSVAPPSTQSGKFTPPVQRQVAPPFASAVQTHSPPQQQPLVAGHEGSSEQGSSAFAGVQRTGSPASDGSSPASPMPLSGSGAPASGSATNPRSRGPTSAVTASGFVDRASPPSETVAPLPQPRTRLRTRTHARAITASIPSSGVRRRTPTEDARSRTKRRLYRSGCSRAYTEHDMKSLTVVLLTMLACGASPGAGVDGGPCNRDGASLPECAPNWEESSCTGAGGLFVHTSVFHTVCECPTRDANCPCSSSTECEGYCELRGAVTDPQCVYAPGLCSQYRSPLGCGCIVGEFAQGQIPSRQAQMICYQ